MRGGNDLNLAIRAQRLNQSVDQSRIDERFIALDVDNKGELACFAGDFGDAIGAAVMTRRGECDFCAPIESRIGDTHIVGSNNYRIQFSCALATFQDMLQKWFASNWI